MLRCIRQYFGSLLYLKVLKEFPYSVSVQFVNIRNINKVAFKKKAHIDHFLLLPHDITEARQQPSSTRQVVLTPSGLAPPSIIDLHAATFWRWRLVDGAAARAYKAAAGHPRQPQQASWDCTCFSDWWPWPWPRWSATKGKRRSDFPEEPSENLTTPGRFCVSIKMRFFFFGDLCHFNSYFISLLLFCLNLIRLFHPFDLRTAQWLLQLHPAPMFDDNKDVQDSVLRINIGCIDWLFILILDKRRLFSFLRKLGI